MIKASDLIKYEIKPFLFGVLFSRIMPTPCNNKNPDKFYIYTNFRTSKAVLPTDFSFINYADELVRQYNSFSGYCNWEIYKVTNKQLELRFYIFNDLLINASQFYFLIHKKLITSPWVYVDKLTEEKKSFIRGYMESRGSVDTSLKLIAQDYFYNNKFELKRVQILTDMMNLPMSYANFNPRDMQPQFIEGIRRNAQFRINLYFYAKEIGFINKYKALVFENAYFVRDKNIRDGIIYYNVLVPNVDKNNIAFIKYLNFFTNNIYEKKLTKAKIEALRKQIGFTDSQTTISRNFNIKAIFDEISEDKCALCRTTKTFTKKSNGRQAFEIHHVIPFHNGKEFDNIANFVKLCPTCHRSLQKGSSLKEDQIKKIITILHQNPEVFEYASSVLGIEEINVLSEKIQSLL